MKGDGAGRGWAVLEDTAKTIFETCQQNTTKIMGKISFVHAKSSGSARTKWDNPNPALVAGFSLFFFCLSVSPDGTGLLCINTQK